jgi:hypothetical protein
MRRNAFQQATRLFHKRYETARLYQASVTVYKRKRTTSCTNKLVRKLWFNELHNCRRRERRSVSITVGAVATLVQCPSLRKVRTLFVLITFLHYSHFRKHFRFKDPTYFVAKPPVGVTIIWEFDKLRLILQTMLGHAAGAAVGWGTALQAGRLRFPFPVVSLEFFIDIILPAALWTWRWLSL